MSSTEATSSTSNLDTARSLQAKLDAANLKILNAKTQFKSYKFEGIDDWPLGEETSRDPAIIASLVAAQISFLRKLKFQYLEQKAKDKYIKTIVSDIDDAPLVTAASNAELRLRNEGKKEILKAAKSRIAEKYQDIRTLAPLVEEDYLQTKALTEEASSLSQKILDARLALTRLRQAHPHPRLTIESANAQLDSQIAEMQDLDTELQQVNEKIAATKENIKTGAKEVERLRVEKAEAEKIASACKEEVEDARIFELYDWYTASLALHKSLLSLESSHSVSENELRLTYMIGQNSPSPREISITLLFLPNTRQLVAAQVQGVEIEIGDVIDSYVQSNDISGFLWAVLARARKAV
ncbi:hypothetical protein SERLA73DRAFT_101905 [Serpula lacrymans var. lacrymans S7.3]|uniref:Kinetochore protein Sos7 coiled-coil domain-containing protein n=2 Tax=Serpula lacrymans var. lacrymans TaxID=341189 RepID=F8PIN5_SERL3|nr:uncharacterized protein SERLADRAFT_445326 [Serpula lacrymans var. lacrymans S7.9]EGO03668.1 hypothetical protein SERLA73DRAFT_101905 [Serpula lacrymans var. lacrymans S7.3]EGO29531.1 hypothetical protein SERLADRAFT_445326 [Serpula lacrymans var. lacrymans S7.9]